MTVPDDEPTTVLEEVVETGTAVPVLLSTLAGGRVIRLKTGNNLVGRSTSAAVRLDREGVSRRHAVIRVRGDVVTIRDLGSTNGTFLDGQRVDQAVLRDGCVVRFGAAAEARFLLWRGARGVEDPEAKLSKRELQIARLVARGLSNEEVGVALGIARRTVSTHLSRIYARVGIGSRLELANKLAEWGLAED